MGFEINHTVRFHETDGAGVVYFATGLVICHTAYEASLGAAGINLADFFEAKSVAYPVVHTRMDYRRPMRCGDVVQISLVPLRCDPSSFEVNYDLALAGSPQTRLAQALTRHVCIHAQHRTRLPLPPEMVQWLQRWAD